VGKSQQVDPQIEQLQQQPEVCTPRVWGLQQLLRFPTPSKDFLQCYLASTYVK
jgi:hypothetical protein